MFLLCAVAVVLGSLTLTGCPFIRPSTDLFGEWVNADPGTDGITRLIITDEVLLVGLHGYGKCHPTDCDWGTITTFYTGNPFTATYEFSFKTETLTIELADANTLKVHAKNVFHDGTGRDYEADYTMHKAGAAASDLVGNWANDDPSTGGMTRAVICQDASNLIIHGYGKCSPTDCDWGPITVPFTGIPLTAVYEFGFKTETLTLSLSTPGALHIHSKNVFHDGSGRDYEADYDFHLVPGGLDDFVGTWVNDVAETDGMTRLILGKDGTDLTVHGYGKCTPTDCDWGTISVPFSCNPVEAVYEFGFKTDTLTILLVDADSMWVHSKNVFHDGTARDYEADYFLHPGT